MATLSNDLVANSGKSGNSKYYCEVCDFGVFTESSLEKHNQSLRHLRLTK